MARKLGITSKLKGYFSIASAARPSTRSRWRARTPRSRTAASGSTAAMSGTSPRGALDRQEEAETSRSRNARSATNESAIETRCSRRSSRAAPGSAPSSTDRPVAGKTGTTENYGDAWFVGYTPQLAVAVWVGYPDTLQPMLTEYHGDPVAGGTFPALIFKAFMEKALPQMDAQPESFPPPSYPYASPKRVVFRDGRWRLDNGLLQETRASSSTSRAEARHDRQLQAERGGGAGRDRPDLRRGARRGSRSSRSTLRRSTSPPGRGSASASSSASFRRSRAALVVRHGRLVVTKATNGVVPNVVGKPVAKARDRLTERGLEPIVPGGCEGPPGRVLVQHPAAGVAAEPRMRVRLVVSKAKPHRSPARRQGEGAERLRNREPARTNRHGRSSARLIPIRGTARISGVVVAARRSRRASGRASPRRAPS